MHGGLATGGVRVGQHNRAANRARLERQALRRLLGQKAPWGRRAKIDARLVAEHGRAAIVADAIEVLGFAEGLLEPVPQGKSLAEMTMAELMSATAQLGLMRIHEILARPRYEPLDIKEERLLLDTGLGVLKVFARVGEAALRGRQNDRLAAILEQIRLADREK